MELGQKLGKNMKIVIHFLYATLRFIYLAQLNIQALSSDVNGRY